MGRLPGVRVRGWSPLLRVLGWLTPTGGESGSGPVPTAGPSGGDSGLSGGDSGSGPVPTAGKRVPVVGRNVVKMPPGG